MPGLGHVAVGLAVSRHAGGLPRRWAMPLLAGLAVLPDLDVVANLLGAGYFSPIAHRGIFHSPFFAALVALGAALLARALGGEPLRWGLLVLLAVGSHGLLDSLTEGDLGVPLAWPFSARRFHAPRVPFPMTPVRLSLHGLKVALLEAAIFSPLLAYAFWPQRRRAGSP